MGWRPEQSFFFFIAHVKLNLSQTGDDVLLQRIVEGLVEMPEAICQVLGADKNKHLVIFLARKLPEYIRDVLKTF